MHGDINTMDQNQSGLIYRGSMEVCLFMTKSNN
ncbi:hypothetical protein BD65_1336 [Yersinia ruckeri]|nr:hypothetical protein BD65_1336 [Yersinia ruckeri]